MAIVTRYFSTSGAGAADGTTWADRAALFSAGNWSTIINGFDFSTTDSLKCLIGPGTYTCSQELSAALLAIEPTVANPLLLCGCDSSGNLLAPPDPDWKSAQPDWDTSGLPVIATTTNIATISVNHVAVMLLKFTASGRNGVVLGSTISPSWCYIENSTSNTAAQALSTAANNCILKCTGSSYNSVGGANYVNCRIEGVTGSSGDRRGVEVTGSIDLELDGCTIVNCGGDALHHLSTNASGTITARNCVIANNGGAGIAGNSIASQTDFHVARQCMITGNGGYGINAQSEAAFIATDNRLRDNTSGNFNGFDNYPTDLNNETTDSDDATDYVDAGAGDFRIKYGSPIWGMGVGVADEPAPEAEANGGNYSLSIRPRIFAPGLGR